MRLHALVLVSIGGTLWPGHIGRQVGAAAQLGTAQRNLGFIVNGGGLQPDSGFGLRGQLLGKGGVFQDIGQCLLYRLRVAVVHEFLFRRCISKKSHPSVALQHQPSTFKTPGAQIFATNPQVDLPVIAPMQQTFVVGADLQ